MKTVVFSLSLLMVSSLYAVTAGNSGVAFLHHYDKDKDGKVSLDEFRADADQQFKLIDTDGDGYATAEEAAAFEQEMREMMKKHRGAAPKTKKGGSGYNSK